MSKKEPGRPKAIINKFIDGQSESIEGLYHKVDFSVKYDYDRMKDLVLLDGIFLTALKRAYEQVYMQLDTGQYIVFYSNHDFKPLR